MIYDGRSPPYKALSYVNICMKYKNIYSAIHNIGHSFTSLMNYVDNDYVIDELWSIHRKGYDIEVDWLLCKFEPEHLATPRIKKSISYRCDSLKKQLSAQNVDFERLVSLKFIWPFKQRKYMLALDDKGKEYKIYVNEFK